MTTTESKSVAYESRDSIVSEYVQAQMAREMAAFYSAFQVCATEPQKKGQPNATNRTPLSKKQAER